MSRNGRIRVRLDREEAAARDRTFMRFMEAVTAALDKPAAKPEPPSAARDDEEDEDDDWPAT
jgi:hypothetical protein